jgi:hypothetical protein
MKLLVLIAASVVILLAPLGCDDAPTPAPAKPPVAKESHYSPSHRFENVSGVGQTGVALDTVTGQWCKTWEWVYKSSAMSGGLDTLPSCLSIYESTPVNTN